MELRELVSFVAVVEESGFHKAAVKLNYAQSSISAHVQSLEDELGVKLFDRLGRRIRLTEAGEHLLSYARRLLSLEEQARAQLSPSREMRGKLTIRVPSSICTHRLPRALAAFHGKYPRVRISLINCTDEGLLDELAQGICDLAFLLTDSTMASVLDAEILGHEELVLVASPGHPLTRHESLPTKDLSGQTFLLSRTDCSYRRRFRQVLRESGVDAERLIEFRSVSGLKQCVAAGTGISVLPLVAVRAELERGELVILPWTRSRMPIAMMMIWHRGKWLSPALKCFMDEVRKSLQGELKD
jgi:DNA-binding transcriptional LysR family regulator